MQQNKKGSLKNISVTICIQICNEFIRWPYQSRIPNFFQFFYQRFDISFQTDKLMFRSNKKFVFFFKTEKNSWNKLVKTSDKFVIELNEVLFLPIFLCSSYLVSSITCLIFVTFSGLRIFKAFNLFVKDVLCLMILLQHVHLSNIQFPTFFSQSTCTIFDVKPFPEKIQIK